MYGIPAEESRMSYWRSLARSPTRRLLLFTCVAAFLLYTVFPSVRRDVTNRASQHVVIVSPAEADKFEKLSITGFTNSRIPDGTDCEQLRLPGELGVTKSLHIDDDLLDIATSVMHPILDYSGQEKGQSFAKMVAKTWGRMAGASVWLPEHGVFLTVSRVYFYDKGVRHWPVINFIRAQIHDTNWKHLKGFELEWQGEKMIFPRMLDVPVPYNLGGGFYGPEDPRIIIEHDVPNAEPVVIFNMIENTTTSRRSMHAFRPFSNFTTTFYIENQEPNNAEKNWAPFFVPHSNTTVRGKWPSRYIHFVYDYHPLKILRCHLLNGACAWVYQQNIQDAYEKLHKHNDTKGVMRGGTNFEPVTFQSRPGLNTFVGFPRTHTDAGCGQEATYRPELMLLTTNGTHFYIDYSSEALDFGHSLLTSAQRNDACDAGRILLANGIAKFDEAPERDEMTMSFTVADSTVQVATVQGVRRLIEGLPHLSRTQWRESDVDWKLNVTSDVLICSIQSASDYAIARTKPTLDEEEQLKEKVMQDIKDIAIDQ